MKTGRMTTQQQFGVNSTGALLSACGDFRYHLFRVWDSSKPPMVFVMLNPSSADGSSDDPTIRRCMRFAKDGGYGGLEVVNCYAYRTSSPKLLKAKGWPIGPDNDHHLQAAFIKAAEKGVPVVCAWGADASRTPRAGAVLRMIQQAGAKPVCLGKTAEGYPRHPLYMRSDCALVAFP
jgi:hypothetical protein